MKGRKPIVSVAILKTEIIGKGVESLTAFYGSRKSEEMLRR
jgi:hypothetical protein